MDLLPLLLGLSAVLAGLAPALSHRLPRLAGLVLGVSVAAILGAFLRLPEGATYQVPWLPQLGMEFSLNVTPLGRVMAALVLGIGALILIYAGSYMEGDARLGRLLALLLAFMTAMLGLVLSEDAITLFLFWEMTSVTSYLLIGFNHEKDASRKKALQAMVVTGAGGLVLLAGLLMAGMTLGTFSLSEMNRQGDVLRASPLYPAILGCVAVGCFAKSAQFPLHFWLPNAMDAPTPVSAYLHSATMVKAGVFLLARLSPALGGTELWFSLLVTVGSLTAVVGGILSLVKTDLKQILAYSTISALGFLVLSLGVGNTAALKGFSAFLVAHALYKGALFMVAGGIDHALHTREVPSLAGLRRPLPLTAFGGGLAALGMMGVPLWLAFVGKEYILEALLHQPILAAVGGIFAACASAGACLVGLFPFWRGACSHTEAHEGSTGMHLGPWMLGALGLIGGLSLGGYSAAIAGPLVAAISGVDQTVTLKPWHGVTPALILSGAALVAGVILALQHPRWVALGRPGKLWVGAEYGYERALSGLVGLARSQTELFQHGKLRLYIGTVFITAVLLVQYGILSQPRLHPIPIQVPLVHEVVIAVVSVSAAVAAALSRSRLSAIAMLGITGFTIATLYMLLGAPDLAITQLLIEALTVVLFVLAFYHLPRFTQLSSRAGKLRDGVIATAVGLTMAFLALQVSATPAPDPISAAIADRSLAEAYGRNIVNTIIVDFRALDTLGEITVLALAALGVFGLIKLKPRPGEHP